jgi:hypothetical protein
VENREITASTAVIAINPQSDVQFVEYRRQAQEILTHAKAEVVTNDAEQNAATNDLGIISSLKKGIEEKRQEYVRPINEHAKTINSAFKLLTDPIDEADRILRDIINKYRIEVFHRRQEAEEINRQKEELARREAALNQGVITIDTTPVAVPEAPAAHVRAEAATLGTAKTWKFEVEDFAKLPDEYKIADQFKIGKVVRAGVNIPGVRSWQEDSIRISAAR